MGFGKINVWIRDRGTCVVVPAAGKVTVTACCGKFIDSMDISKGHAELTEPPGCYVVHAEIPKSKQSFETMVIVNCDKSACVNFLLLPLLLKKE